MALIISESEARAETSMQANMSRQQRRAFERAASKLADRHARAEQISDGVVDRSLGGATHGMVVGDEARGAKIGDVIQLMTMALAEYDQTKNVELIEYVEYRLSIRGRLAMQRKKWLYRAGVVVRYVAQIPAVRAMLERIHSARYGRPTPPQGDGTATGDRG